MEQARCAEVEAERDVLAAAAGVTPERCRAAKAQLFEAAKLCAPPEALPGYSVEYRFGRKGAEAMPFAKLWCLEGCPKMKCSAATMR